MLKIQQVFPKLYRCLLYVVFHNLELQNVGLVDVKKDLNLKKLKGIVVPKILKISIVIKNVIGFEDTLMHKAIIFSNSFTHNHSEKIKKGAICVQILLEIHLTENSIVNFQG